MTETPPYTPFGVDYITELQFWQLLKWLNPDRVEQRNEGGKALSYLNHADDRAHLTRIFGFGRWDSRVLEHGIAQVRDTMVNVKRDRRTGEVTEPGQPGFAITCTSLVELSVRSISGVHLCTHAEVAAATNVSSDWGMAYESALKSASSDALKRCCINLGDQFGLGLYRRGDQRSAMIGDSIVSPVRFGAKKDEAEPQREVVDLQRPAGPEHDPDVGEGDDDPYAALDAAMESEQALQAGSDGDGAAAEPSEGWGGGMAAAIERVQYERDMTMASGGGAEAADGAYAAQLDREGITQESVAAERARRDAEHQEAAIQRTKEKVAKDFEQREF